MGYTLLLECNAPGAGKGVAMKEKNYLKNNNNKYNYELLTLKGVPGNSAQHTHTSRRG